LETGVGGLCDLTNTIQRSNKLAVITKLGLDHTVLLGDTIADIAYQKAGIMPHSGVAIVLQPDDPSARVILDRTADERHTKILYIENTVITDIDSTAKGSTFVFEDMPLHLPILGRYQIENAMLAISVMKYLSARDMLSRDQKIIQHGLNNLNIPGRAEIRQVNGHMIILDSAHNPQKIQAFCELIASLGFSVKPVVVYATKKSKDYHSSLNIMKDYISGLVATEFFVNIPKPVITCEASAVLAQTAQAMDINVIGNFSDPNQALKYAIKNIPETTPIIVTGSMYLLGEIQNSLNLQN